MLNRVFQFYLDGFRSMRLGRTLWKIILLKLLVIFAVIKLLFLPNVLETHFDNDHDRAEYVLRSLTKPQVASGNEAGLSIPGNNRAAISALEVSRD